jgi:hypothetical protein
MRATFVEAEGTPAELAEFERRRRLPSSNGIGDGNGTPPGVTSSSSTFTAESAAAFYAKLGGAKKVAVDLLVPAGTSGLEFKGYLKAMNLSTGKQLAGILSGVTRVARGVTGNHTVKPIDYRTLPAGKSEYFITEPLLSLLAAKQ